MNGDADEDFTVIDHDPRPKWDGTPRNRAERRAYNKRVVGPNRRAVRTQLVGFGRVKKHRYLSRLDEQ
jgi:hypothetical protein